MKISRSDTEYLKGIAILLMLGHHLFAFPERILSPSFFIPLPGGLNIEGLAGSFGKICVGVFLFLSGYGFAVSGLKGFRYYAEKVWRFLQVYWFYFAIFIPIGLVFFNHVTFFNSTTPRYEADPMLFILNASALTFSYNEEWWFVQPYLLLVLSAPLTLRLAKKPPVLIALSAALYNFAWILEWKGLNTPYISAVWIFRWQLPFVIGVLAAVWSARIEAALERMRRTSPVIIPVAAGTGTAFLWNRLHVTGLILATPLFLILCLELKRWMRGGWRLFTFTGGYSFPIWLTHSFFCYYYWQKAVYWPKYSPLVFLNLAVMSLAVCMAAEKLRAATFALPGRLRSAWTEYRMKRDGCRPES